MGLGDLFPLLPQVLDVKLDGLRDELEGFFPRLSRCNAAGEVRNIGAEAGWSLLEDDGVFHASKVTKTRRSTRKIELLKPAREALQAQRKLSGDAKPVPIEVSGRDNRTLQSEHVRLVFLKSDNGKPFEDDGYFRKRFWIQHLKDAGVRLKPPQQCQHTFIRQMLTASMPTDWIVPQVGHTTPEMIRRRYGKWVNEDRRDMVQLAEKLLGL